MKSILFSTATALVLAGGLAHASTVTVDFDSGVSGGGIYSEAGFTFTSDSSGGAGLASNCPTGPGGANTSCLQFNNDEVITVTYMGGLAFDLDGFVFNGPGNGGDILVTGGGSGETLTETNNGNSMSAAMLTNAYDGILSFTFQNAGNGSGRVDDIGFTVTTATVPLPASGLLILSGLAAIAAKRRRKTA